MSEEKQSSKFKVGDKVRCIDSRGSVHTKLGEIYTVLNIKELFPDCNYLYLEEDPDGQGAFDTRFELAQHSTPKVLSDPQGKTSGFKDDAKKPDLTDVPLAAMWQMGQAFTYGQKKYSKNNYRTGMHVSRQLAAAVRHIYQHLDGQNNDAESGCTHLGHAMASLAMAIYNLENNPEMDDRFDKDIKKHGVKSE